MPPIRGHLQANALFNRQPEESKLAPSNPELFLKEIHFQPLITLKYTKLKLSLEIPKRIGVNWNCSYQRPKRTSSPPNTCGESDFFEGKTPVRKY
jgi:hypothetical protein